jgi:glyoxylase-like metal-dependent hydrolase (beta-lactamase superfamily II)
VDGGEAMLADITTGGREIPMQAIDVLAEKYHIGEIDSFLVTHIHENHVSSLKRLADTVMIRRVLLPEPQTEAEARYVAMLRERLNGACAVEFYRRDGTDTVRVGDTEVTLPRYETIARSTHPVITFSAACGNGDRWIYCGASAMELFDTWDAVRGCDTLILGAHGPKEKYFIDEECLEDVKQIIVANEESAELLRVDETKTAVVTVNADCAIRFERERRQTVP